MAGVSGKHVAKTRNAEPLPAPRKLGRALAGGTEPVARVDRGEFVGRPLRERTARVGRAIEQRIVVDDDDAVAREVDVELEPVSAKREAIVERGQGVLGPERRAASMRVDERPLCWGARCTL